MDKFTAVVEELPLPCLYVSVELLMYNNLNLAGCHIYSAEVYSLLVPALAGKVELAVVAKPLHWECLHVTSLGVAYRFSLYAYRLVLESCNVNGL